MLRLTPGDEPGVSRVQPRCRRSHAPRSDTKCVMKYRIAVDEAGRGCWAGPLVVGAVAIPLDNPPLVPKGLTDSKRLTARARTALEPQVQAWASAWGVGAASALEVDTLGVTAASRLAGHRALASIWMTIDPADIHEVLLDGSHDYLTGPTPKGVQVPVPTVWTMAKADLVDVACSGASVLAKVEHDRLMGELAVEFPEYGWLKNQGYPTPAHSEAVRVHGLSEHHRFTWAAPGSGKNASRKEK